MRILELKAENFARLKAVTIRPDGALVQITGANDAGKSSALGAIWACLKGRAAAPPVPIRKGAEEARIQLELGRERTQLKVTRTFATNDAGELTTSVAVVSDGRRITSKPQALLDAVLGEFAIDPLAFARMPAKDQFDRIKALVPGFDFATVAAERERLYNARTDANRQEKTARAAGDSVVLPPGPEPKAVDVSASIDALQAAGATNQQITAERAERRRRQTAIDGWLDEAEQLRARAAGLEAKAKTEQAGLDALPALGEPVDTEALRAGIAAAESTNAVRAKHAIRRDHHAAADQWAAKSAAYTAGIDALNREKQDAIEAAKIPVDGLSFGDGVVLLNGLPFAQAAMSQKLRASTQLAIALNDRPDALRLVTIDEGSELDSHSLAALEELAEQHDFQIILTRVDESGAVGFVLEDGALVP